MNSFHLHPRLQEDCFQIGEFNLCSLLMMNDQQFPWFILVPKRNDITEIYQLTDSDRQLLINESCLLTETLACLYHADKMNVANIGNIVSQLHVHHIVRYTTDLAWPAPVWGKHPCLPYEPEQAQIEITKLKLALNAYLIN